MAGVVVVVGSANLDHVVEVAALPPRGATVAARAYRSGPGGKGLNQAVAAARSGAAARLVCCLGADGASSELLDLIVAEGIDAAFVSRSEHAPTGVALITVESGGANTIVVVGGANLHLDPPPAAAFGEASVVLTQMEIRPDVVLASLTVAKQVGATTLLNPAPASEPLPVDLLRLVDVIVPNETEAAYLTGEATPEAAARALIASGVGAAVVTLGARGALVATRSGTAGAVAVEVVPSLVVDALDSTAAGDTFCGVLAGELAAGQSLDLAVKRAASAGALCATRPGAVDSIPTAAEIDAASAAPACGDSWPSLP